jgi:hypothetical protein
LLEFNSPISWVGAIRIIEAGAMYRLEVANEKQSEAVGSQMSRFQRLRRWLMRPSRLRVERNLDSTRREIDFLAQRSKVEDRKWKLAADDALDRADQCLKSLDLVGSWSALSLAKRFAVFGLTQDELEEMRVTLLEESQSGKLKSWRKEAIRQRLKDATKLVTPQTLADTMAIRDEAADTEYYKIAITGQQINVLLRVCLLAIVVYLVAIWLARLTPAAEYPDAWTVRRLASVLLVGLLGAALSTLRGLITTDLSRRVPDWVANRSITIGRLLSGYFRLGRLHILG